jgi:hypothetical protein
MIRRLVALAIGAGVLGTAVSVPARSVTPATVAPATPGIGVPGGPSRAPEKGCAWRKLADAKLGLEVWVQRCQLDKRIIDFRLDHGSLFIHWSDGGDDYATLDVLPMGAGETAEAAIRRVFRQHTPKSLAERCVLSRYTEGSNPPDAERYTFVPAKAYQKELDRQKSDGVPDPPCGDWGEAPDGIQYFEVQPTSGARNVLFVRVGQDAPLFDEMTLRLLPPR